MTRQPGNAFKAVKSGVVASLMCCLLFVNGPTLAQTRLDTLNRQVETLHSARRFDDALRLAQQALSLAEAAFGRGDLETSEPLLQIGNIYLALGRTNDAESVLTRALAIREQALGPNNGLVAAVR